MSSLSDLFPGVGHGTQLLEDFQYQLELSIHPTPTYARAMIKGYLYSLRARPQTPCQESSGTAQANMGTAQADTLTNAHVLSHTTLLVSWGGRSVVWVRCSALRGPRMESRLLKTLGCPMSKATSTHHTLSRNGGRSMRLKLGSARARPVASMSCPPSTLPSLTQFAVQEVMSKQ